MRILDRERYWAFLKAYLICFVALVGLYVVIDAFTNLDEFVARTHGFGELMRVMGQFYLLRMSLFYDQLCGIISMMAAIFTVTWMQKNNELIAMLAAGISTYRVIRPVLVSAVLVSGLAVANQELILPEIAEDLQKAHGDDGTRKVPVYSRFDGNDILISGKSAVRAARTVLFFDATMPVKVLGVIRQVQAKEARYIAPTDPAPLKGGWLLRGARISASSHAAGADRESELLVQLKDTEGFPRPVGKPEELKGDTYFLRTDLTFEAVSRSRQWYQFASTKDLIRGVSDPAANDFERMEVGVFLHGRLLRPFLSMTLMFLSLPIVLGGAGGNMFINLASSLGLSGCFYATLFFSHHLGSNDVVSPELAAWLPLIGFGTLAVFRWDKIKT